MCYLDYTNTYKIYKEKNKVDNCTIYYLIHLSPYCNLDEVIICFFVYNNGVYDYFETDRLELKEKDIEEVTSIDPYLINAIKNYCTRTLRYFNKLFKLVNIK